MLERDIVVESIVYGYMTNHIDFLLICIHNKCRFGLGLTPPPPTNSVDIFDATGQIICKQEMINIRYNVDFRNKPILADNTISCSLRFGGTWHNTVVPFDAILGILPDSNPAFCIHIPYHPDIVTNVEETPPSPTPISKMKPKKERKEVSYLKRIK